MFDLTGKTALVTGASEHLAGERSGCPSDSVGNVARATIEN